MRNHLGNTSNQTERKDNGQEERCQTCGTDIERLSDARMLQQQQPGHNVATPRGELCGEMRAGNLGAEFVELDARLLQATQSTGVCTT